MDTRREKLVAEICSRLNQAKDKDPGITRKRNNVLFINLNVAVLFGVVLGATSTVVFLQQHSPEKQNPLYKTDNGEPRQREFDFYKPVNELPTDPDSRYHEKDLPPLPPEYKELTRLQKI